MNHDPFVLPGPPGEKTLADNLDRGALFEDAEDGAVYVYRGLLPGGRWVLCTQNDEPRPLFMPDPQTGFPQHPTERQMIDAMASGRLHLISSPLDTPARNRARGEEKTKEEVLGDDPYAEVRMSVCRLADKEKPAKDVASLEEWAAQRFDWKAIEEKHGRAMPPGSTFLAWIKKRGRPGNRCWADMEDRRGQGPRAKRVTGHRLAIAVWHAISHWSARRHPSISKLWGDVEADTRAYNTGQALIMHGGQRRWPVPETPIAPADPEFFRQLVKRLESRTAYKGRWSAQAAQQRWEGGGGAPEPVRFLEVVQQDETEVPGFFFIDSINRVPLGVATWVIAVDVFTRCVLAWDLSFDAPSTISWMRNVLNASMMKPLPKEYAERFPALATIGGRMSSIVYDNGQHLTGHAVEDAHGDLVQDVIFAGEGEPTHKGLVERTHETLRGLFVAELPGAKMSIALSREFNMDPTKETLLTLEEARLAMARAVCKYHTKELKGLDWRTPLDVWVEQWNRWGPQHPKDQKQFARAIGNVTYERALDNGGVVEHYLGYSDVNVTPELMEAYALHSHQRRNTKKPTFDCKVKIDPSDLSKVWVFDPVRNSYRELPAKKKRYTQGLTIALHRLVLRYRGSQSLMEDEVSEDRLLEIRRLAETELKRISPKMEIAEQRARAAMMQHPAARALLGDAIELVEVAPSPTGMEVKHDLGLDRADALHKPPRGKRGSKANDLRGEGAERDAELDMAPRDAPAPVSRATEADTPGTTADEGPESDAHPNAVHAPQEADVDGAASNDQTGDPDDDDDGGDEDLVGSFGPY